MDKGRTQIKVDNDAQGFTSERYRKYASRKEEGINSSASKIGRVHRFEDNIKKGKLRLIPATRNNTKNTGINRKTITRKQKLEES